MTASFAPAAHHAASARVPGASSGRILAAAAAAMARAKARHEYRRLLACDDEIMRDVGVTRDDVRRALMESGGRL